MAVFLTTGPVHGRCGSMAIALSALEDVRMFGGTKTLKMVMQLDRINASLCLLQEDQRNRLGRLEEFAAAADQRQERAEAKVEQFELELRTALAQVNRSLSILANAAVTALEQREPVPFPAARPRRAEPEILEHQALPPPVSEELHDQLAAYVVTLFRKADAAG